MPPSARQGLPSVPPPPEDREPWPEPGEVVLETRGLSKDLGTTVRTRVLKGIDLAIRKREFVSLTGLSGSGKSTLLYLLGALDRPTEGQVLIDGVSIGELDDEDRSNLRGQQLGFVFQFHFLLNEFTSLENVMLPMMRRGGRPREQVRTMATEALAAVGLEGLEERRPHQLSGGQQQRVSIARAVANEPRILLADEPTGNLDSKNGILVIDIFERLVRTRGITVVMVTHERSFAARCSRQIQLQDGQKIADETHR